MNLRTLRVGLLIASVGAVSGVATAQTAPGMSPVNAAGPGPQATPAVTAPAQRTIAPSASTELADLQAQIPLLQARATIAELNARIAKATADGGRGILPVTMQSSMVPVPSGGPLINTNAVPAATRAVRPEGGTDGMSITSLTGFDGQYRAVINVGGVEEPAVPGASIGAGWTVKAVTGAGVTLVKGKQTVVLRG